MPLYAYRCNNCGHEFEKRQRMIDDPLTDCPMCEGQVRRIVNAVGVVFKGSGFYITDSRNGKNASLSKAGTETTPPKSDKPDKVDNVESLKPAAASSPKAGSTTASAPASAA